MGICLAAVLSAADAPTAPSGAGRRLTVSVDARTGRLVRVPASRFARAVPEKVVEAREIQSATPRQEAPRSANAVPQRSLDELIERVAQQYGIRPSFVHAVIKAESNYNPRAVSHKGALGLMQLMPRTALRLGVNPFDPAQNVEGGVRYLRYLLDTYNSDARLSLAAYNAGPAAVDRYGSVPPYPETRQFVNRVSRLYNSYNQQPPAARFTAAPKKLAGPRIYYTRDSSGFIRYTTEPQ